MATQGELDSVLRKQLMLHKIVSELISMSSSQTNPGEFLSSFLRSAVRLIDGSGGTVWVKRGDTLQPAFHTGKTTEVQPIDDEGESSDEGVLDKISADIRPFVFPMSSTDGDSNGLIGIYIPIEVEDGLFAVLKVVKQRASNVVYQEEIEILSNMGGLVRLYLNQLNLPRVVGKVEEIQKLFQVSQEIFSSIDGDQIAYSVANLVPGVMSCERCIVGVIDRGKLKIKAITGQDFIEKKSATVRNIREIFEFVGDRGEAVTIVPDQGEGEVEDGLRELVNSYFDVQPFRVMHAVPIKDDDRLLGVISAETSKEDVFTPSDLSMFAFVSNQTSVALKHARLYKQIPFARTWHRLAAFKEKVASWPRFRLISATVLVLLLVGTVIFGKIDNKIAGDCEVLPLDKYYARSRIDGILTEFLVKEGDRVEAGSVIALLDDTDIRKRLREAESRREVTRANMLKYFGLGQMADYAIEELKIKGVEKEIELLLSDLKDTRIVVDGSGVVLTPTPRFAERLGKPVSKGEELVEVGQLDELLLSVAIPEKDIQFIRSGQKIRFLLNSLPEKHFEVKVDSVRQKTEPRPEGNFFIVESKVDLPNTAFKPGMKGKAKVYADKAPIWKVYLRDMIDFFRVKVFF